MNYKISNVSKTDTSFRDTINAILLHRKSQFLYKEHLLNCRTMVAHRYHPSFHVIALKICNLFLKKLKQNRKIIFCNKKNLFSLLLLFSPSVYYLLFHFFNFFFVFDFYPWPIVIIIKMETRLLFPLFLSKSLSLCDSSVTYDGAWLEK